MASKIEWTNETWNPVTGCTKISSGCKNCYAERMSKRLLLMGLDRYKNGFKTTTHDDVLLKPYSWKKSRLIFVNSMSDLFHKSVPLSFIKEVFKVMNECPQHTFQILTKRSDRLKEVASELNWSNNIWMGVSVENQDTTFRVHDLLQVNSHVRFLSVEPLIGPISKIKLKGIDWVIVGGESGPGSRPMEEKWVLKLRDLCNKMAVPFFFKQWGGVNKKKAGRKLEDREWNQMPVQYL